MDNTPNSIMQTINETLNNDYSDAAPSVNSSVMETGLLSDSGNGWFSSFSSISITTWLIIFFVLAILGFNIFVYLAKGTQDITNFFKPIIDSVLKLFGSITGQVIDTTATGAKSVVNTSANAIDSTLTSVQNAIPDGKNKSGTTNGTDLSKSIPQADIMQNKSMNVIANTNQNVNPSDNDYQADDASSSIQKSLGKGGYCYIGEERGIRSCMQVDSSDMCMSGEIFPTQEICVNPNLRM